MESESFYGECTGPVLVGGRCNGDPRWILHGCSSDRHKNESAIQPSCTFPFPGVTLSEKEPIAQFDVPDIPEEYIVHSHKLIIKQISLGPEALGAQEDLFDDQLLAATVVLVHIPRDAVALGGQGDSCERDTILSINHIFRTSHIPNPGVWGQTAATLEQKHRQASQTLRFFAG